MANSKTSSPPPWAEIMARAWHHCGMIWPEIEKQLIAKGLGEQEAHAVVMRLIEEDILAQQPVPA